MEELVARRLRRRRARRDDDGARRRAGRRGALGRAAPARGGRRGGDAAGRLAWARWTWSTSAPGRRCPRAFARPQPLRAQPERHAHAHDARTSAPSWAGGSRAKLSAATGPVALFVPLRRGVGDRRGEGGRSTTPTADAALFAALRAGLDAARRGARARRRHQRPGVRRRHGRDAHGARRRFDWDGRQSERRTEARRAAPATLGGRPARSSAPGPAPACPRSAPRRGGADLIIIYNSGRYRMAGRGSLAGLMPYGDANAIVMEMAARGAAGRRGTPPCSPACAAPTRSG